MRYAWFSYAAVMGALCVWGGCGLTHHIIAAFDAWGGAALDLKPTLDAIDRPCGGGQPCGTLAMLNKTIVKAGDAVVTTQIVERSSAVRVNATMDALATIPGHVNPVLDSAKGTLDAGTTLTQTATATLQTVNDRTPALLDVYTGAGRDLDAMIQDNSPSVKTVLVNTASMTGSGAGILANGKVVSDKITYDYTHPVPWYQQPWKLVTLGVDAALLAK